MGASGHRKDATPMDGLSAPSQMDRIEAKLDALIDALADEHEQEDTAEVRTMDGQVHLVSSRCSTL